MTDNEEIEKLKDALRAFLNLAWMPDGAPGPSCYLVSPVHEARKALQTAGELVNNESPFPSDINGTIMVFEKNGKVERSVWLDGCSYSENCRDLVPPQHLELFDRVLAEHTIGKRAAGMTMTTIPNT